MTHSEECSTLVGMLVRNVYSCAQTNVNLYGVLLPVVISLLSFQAPPVSEGAALHSHQAVQVSQAAALLNHQAPPVSKLAVLTRYC